MKLVLTKSMFRDEFKHCNRANQFSYEALGALYDYLKEMEELDGEEYELDVVALCCEFSESTYDEIRNDYQNKFDADTSNEEILKALQTETTVIWHDQDTSVLYQQF